MTTFIKKVYKKIKNLNQKRSFIKSFRRVSFSQTGEDIIIDFIFTSRGIHNPTYIDIGAFHPYLYSNTAYFYAKSSKGINIEPNPDGIKLFNKYRSKDINLNIGISSIEGELNYFYMDAATMNTFDSNSAYELQEKYGFKIIDQKLITCLKLQDVIFKYSNNKFPDLLSIDVEGLDMEILDQVDYIQNYPKVICVETVAYSHDGTGVKNIQLIKFLESKGYFVYADTYINTIFINKEFWQNH